MLKTNDSFPKWLTSSFVRFQQMAYEPVNQIAKSTKQFGPTWEEFINNNYSLGDPIVDLNSKGQFIRLGNDIINSFFQINTCSSLLIEEGRRRRKIPLLRESEILIIASDAIIYRLIERINTFIRHPAIVSEKSKSLSKPPKIISEIRKKRGIHTHNYDIQLIDASGPMVLLAALSNTEKNDIERVRKLVLSRARQLCRHKIAEQVQHLNDVENEAFHWIDKVFSDTEPQWVEYLKTPL